MVFSSVIFLFLFLPIVLLIYYTIKKEFRNGTLLLASLLFYTWGEPKFVIIMLASLVANYIFGILVDYFQQNNYKEIYPKLIVALCVIFNIAILVFFKYANFLIGNFNNLLGILDFRLIRFSQIALPIGISFYTFHELSYVIDIYRKAAKVQKNFLDLALYILFFPQLIAGPIIRYHDISDQLKNRKVNVSIFSYGVRRFIVGLSKKVIIANTLGFTADQVFSIPSSNLTFSIAWLGIISYALQIYFDFSGYSDMAIGLARMFGFKFLENFNYPYISKNVTEFWRRWHISLSNWFKEYLYIPLGGNRKGSLLTYRNLIIVFICTGIWHGASWNFLIWGLYYGIFLVLERMKLINFGEKFAKTLGRIYTLLVILVGWVFFRSENLGYSIDFLKSMFGFTKNTEIYSISFFTTPKFILIIMFAILGSTPFVNKVFLKINEDETCKNNMFVRDLYLAALFVISIILLSSSTYNPFIYFRF